jgi:hypothetical protein
MARSLPFFLVDVFADAPLTGNPLAVVADADEVDEQVMRSIAREFNQSETTFVLPSPREDVAWRLRSFTPGGVRGRRPQRARRLVVARRRRSPVALRRWQSLLSGDRGASPARGGDRPGRTPATDRRSEAAFGLAGRSRKGR